MNYIRFVVSEIDEDSQKRLGVFQTIAWLRDDDDLTKDEESYMNDVKKWFNDNLERPTSFLKSTRKNPPNKAISWYKNSATEHISKMWEIVEVLRAHDIQVDVIKTNRPGYIVYEDEFQVAAEPYKDTNT